MPLPLTYGTGGSVVVTQCQACEAGALEPVLFLGYLPPVNTMPLIGALPREQPAYPAQLLRCRRCELVQLGLIVDPQILFPPEYPYTSGTTRILRENFAELYHECSSLIGLHPDDLIVDIGSNDGTLLSNFRAHRVQGIEPTEVGGLANARGIPTIKTFFNREVAAQVRESQGPARIISAANVFAHIENVQGLMESLLLLLDGNGVFISDSHYLVSLIETLQYDTVYHEHLRYYSLTSLRNLLRQHGLEVFHARRIPTHGGSIRVYAARAGQRERLASVSALLEEETRLFADPNYFTDFRRKVALSKSALHSLLLGCQQRGERVYAIGAPSRATTLVNYVGLDDGLLDCVLEITGSLKIGKTMPGTLIPVEDEARLFTDPPAHALLLSWHLTDELSAKLWSRGYQGDFIVPLPEPRFLRQ